MKNEYVKCDCGPLPPQFTDNDIIHMIIGPGLPLPFLHIAKLNAATHFLYLGN